MPDLGICYNRDDQTRQILKRVKNTNLQTGRSNVNTRAVFSADFPHAYDGRLRRRFLDLRVEVTLKFKLIAGF